MTTTGARISVDDFVATPGITLDVRTPAEYRAGHIPGALNVPLFTDPERAEVGTLYVQSGHTPAVVRGFDLVGPRMGALSRILLTLSRLSQQAPYLAARSECGRLQHAIVAGPSISHAIAAAAPQGGPFLKVHCWRGGMRSGSVAWLAAQLGLQVLLLEGGYKAFRRWALQRHEQAEPRLVVLGGLTGSGKSRVLRQLSGSGERIIDLELLARHRGSSFGCLVPYAAGGAATHRALADFCSDGPTAAAATSAAAAAGHEQQPGVADGSAVPDTGLGCFALSALSGWAQPPPLSPEERAPRLHGQTALQREQARRRSMACAAEGDTSGQCLPSGLQLLGSSSLAEVLAAVDAPVPSSAACGTDPGLQGSAGRTCRGLVVTAQPSQEQFENNLAFAMAIQQGKLPLLDPASWQQHSAAAAPLAVAAAAGPLAATLAVAPNTSDSAVQRQLVLSDAPPVWLEDESRSIGKAFLPATLVARMAAPATHLLLMQASQRERVANLCADYAGADPTQLLAATQRLIKKFGHARSGAARASIEAGQHAEAAAVLLQYYDATYSHAMGRKGQRRSAAVTLAEPAGGADTTDAASVKGGAEAAALGAAGSVDRHNPQEPGAADQRSAAWAGELILAERRLQLAAIAEAAGSVPKRASERDGAATAAEIAAAATAAGSIGAPAEASWAVVAVRAAASTPGKTSSALGSAAIQLQGLPSDCSKSAAARPRVWEAVECH